MIKDDIQKNEGSLVYNALSVLAYEMEKLYIQADYIMEQSHAETCDYEHLKLMGADRGLYPYQPSHTVVKAEFNCMVPLGSRFNLRLWNYVVTEWMEGFLYKLQCEESGAMANGILGSLTPITFVEGLEKAEIVEILIPGRDEETRESFYMRYLESFTSDSFGGNIKAYREWADSQEGIGGCKVLPVWNGAGTVKLIVQASDYKAPSSYLIGQLQEAVCPAPLMGYGFAPIGHDVTVEPVEEMTVDISTHIVFDNGYSWDALKSEIISAAEGYLASIREEWQNSTSGLCVYISRLESAVLNVQGVIDISSTILNDMEGNYSMEYNQIPVLGSVVNI